MIEPTFTKTITYPSTDSKIIFDGLSERLIVIQNEILALIEEQAKGDLKEIERIKSAYEWADLRYKKEQNIMSICELTKAQADELNSIEDYADKEPAMIEVFLSGALYQCGSFVFQLDKGNIQEAVNSITYAAEFLGVAKAERLSGKTITEKKRHFLK